MCPSVTDVYRTFDTSLVSDALNEHGIDGVITGLSPAHPDHTAVGRATPIRFERADQTDESTNFPYAMLDALSENHILVIEGVDETLSCWGGRASQLAANAGANGVLVEGGYRDVRDIRQGTFPVFGRTPSPKTGQRRVRVTSTNEAITIDDVPIAPGDIVVADATGVVVVPDDQTAAVADTAEDLLAEELFLERKIGSGATVADLRESGHSF